MSKNFKDIVSGLAVEVKNPSDFFISDIILDSRKVTADSLFVAIKGTRLNGEDFIPQAINDGAKAILVSSSYNGPFESGISYILSSNVAKTLADICAKYYSNKPKNMIAVTGTNGKTSVANFCAKIISKLCHRSAAIGTLGVCVNGDFPDAPEASLTTPDAITLHKTLQQLAEEEINYIAFEASSHGLEQGRVTGLDIKVAGFTNLTQDHLDYHRNMENYFAAKAKLFSEVLPEGGIAVINSDTEYFSELYEICQRRKIKVISYGKKSLDVKLVNFISKPTGQALTILFNNNEYNVETNLLGAFQSYNLLCAITMVHALGFDFVDVIQASQNLNSVRGRMEFVAEKRSGGTIVVDYAHTPDALEKAILALRPHTKGRLITLFGCGGDRDKTKRPLMGTIAAKNSDIVIVTDDNPRTESAADIRSQIMVATPNAMEVNGRLEAIRKGILMLEKGDILLLAGKGHEDYQIIGTEKFPFNEVEIVRKILLEN